MGEGEQSSKLTHLFDEIERELGALVQASDVETVGTHLQRIKELIRNLRTGINEIVPMPEKAVVVSLSEAADMLQVTEQRLQKIRDQSLLRQGQKG
ncbi:MAG TPA: hypothetical protein VI913_00040 [Candidatus Peribacteraceae bacterium]|nr:hypothetical protein [Candidatus Peribacteraceae bacterium]